ncbi:5'-Nucleotidase-like protein [Rubrobacter xylanophilus DSM 9941]|uniref:5'-Nucleotidase-like protein n=1 Tax=Rubrobacter xylanophilus (strain DSM 9941 / JCM 11954 / NBRC 16129 / PRD-1) TaxID=266117 RepID=Q1AZ96_RUBXD|nr:5'-nucleotidase C-terminal domain-containing protein [Rubrobacter xylanophilus]ABG03282.1 5'-Nucleotidase-like protein [Rubrobacter xylanophilus DSM 9941]
MVKSRSTSTLVALAAALALALSLARAADAESGPKNEPVPEGRIAEVQILGFNDFHGWLQSPRSVDGRPVGGAEYLAAYLDREERENPKGTIRIHAGDSVGGSPLISSYFHDEPAIYAMNLMGLDLGTLGNHEFDEGKTEMFRLLNGGQRTDGDQFKTGPDGEPVNTSDPDFPGARFPYIAANTVWAGTEDPILPPYEVIKRRGVKVGFIGVVTPETEQIVIPDAVAPFDFLDISDTVNRYVPKLRKRGVEAIVVLAHSGGFQSGQTATGEVVTETAQMSDAVDAVIAGHSHTFMDTRVDGKLLVQAYSFGTAIEDVDLRIDRRTKDVVGAEAEVITTYRDAIAPDPEVAALVAEYEREIAPVANRVVGVAAEDITRATTPAGESALGDLIADAQRAYAGADFAFMNPGGIRADIAAGEVTFGELFAVQPFDNQVAKMELTGDQIYALLEQQFQEGRTRILQVSGLEFSYDASRPAGQRITSVTLPDGTPIDRSATYTVAANSFIATGGDGFTVFKEGRDQQTLGSDLEALEAYIDGLPQPFEAPDPFADPRITREG